MRRSPIPLPIRDALDIACFRLLVAIEAALAHCFHVSAKRLRRVPEGHAECFGIIRDADILFRRLSGAAQAVAFSRKGQGKRELLDTVFAILARDDRLGPFPYAKIAKDTRENLNPGNSPLDAEAPRACPLLGGALWFSNPPLWHDTSQGDAAGLGGRGRPCLTMANSWCVMDLLGALETQNRVPLGCMVRGSV